MDKISKFFVRKNVFSVRIYKIFFQNFLFNKSLHVYKRGLLRDPKTPFQKKNLFFALLMSHLDQERASLTLIFKKVVFLTLVEKHSILHKTKHPDSNVNLSRFEIKSFGNYHAYPGNDFNSRAVYPYKSVQFILSVTGNLEFLTHFQNGESLGRLIDSIKSILFKKKHLF